MERSRLSALTAVIAAELVLASADCPGCCMRR